MRMLPTAVAFLAIVGIVSVSGAQSPPSAEMVEEQESPQSFEQWYYQEMLDRYDNPKTAVRKKAEFRSQQRQARIAAMKWYGFSNSRPIVPAQPFTSHAYGPRWEGNWLRPFVWHTTGYPVVVVQPGYRVYR